MQDLIAQLLLMLRGAWRYRWPAMLLTWVVALGGWLAVAAIPDRFQARAQVQVNTESLLNQALEGLAVPTDEKSRLQEVQATLLNNVNLARVANQADLMLEADSEEEREGVVESLRERITLTGVTVVGTARRPQSTNQFMISFEDPNPKTALRVVQGVHDIFMESVTGIGRVDADVATRFLERQRDEYGARLAAAESQLAAFKKANVGVVPGTEGRNFYDRLDEATVHLEQLRAEYRQVSERRNELMRQLQGEEPTFGLTASAGASPIDSQIASYQARIDQLLVQYTDKHPEVVALKDTIARLEAEKAQGAKVSSTIAPPGTNSTSEDILMRSLDMNPVYQNMKIGLSQADARLAELRGQISAEEQAMAGLRERMDTIPAVEAELARLDRDRQVNKEQYDQVLKRLESAVMSGRAGENSESVKFETVEAPSVPVTPSAPDRVLLSALVLLASLGAGLGFALLLQQVRPVFSTKDTLRQVTGLPVLGSVTAAIVHSFVPWYRRQTALVGGALAALGVAFLLNVLLQQNLRAVLRNLLG
jgi:polysaccharide chain length determinant protein (PEP-CTERM system associated)